MTIRSRRLLIVAFFAGLVSSATLAARLMPLTIQDLKGAHKKLTVAANNQSIESVVHALVDDANISLVVRDLDADRRISVKFESTPRDQALYALAYDLDLFYEVPSPKKLIVMQWSHLSRQAQVVPREPHVKVPTVIDSPAATYPELARLARFEGRLLVEITIVSDGSVLVGPLTHCDLNHASHGPSDMNDEICPVFYSAASEALAQWRFDPPDQEAVCDFNIAFKFR